MSRRQCGFSLIELVIIIVVVSVAAVGLLSLWTGIGRSAGQSEETQTATQLAQECAEHILAQKRVNPTVGYDNITTTVCNGLPAFTGYTRSVTLTPTTASPCPVATAGQCQLVRVQVDHGLVTSAADMTFLLVR
jgi:type II secretory pathway pseudopilin PulG